MKKLMCKYELQNIELITIALVTFGNCKCINRDIDGAISMHS